MKKVLIVASVASMISQFNIPNLNLLKEMDYEVHVACNFEKGNTCDKESIKKLKVKLKAMDICCVQINFAREVLDLKQNRKAYAQIYRLLSDEKYAFIHCHSPIGGVIGRIAAARTNTKVIYTAHGFHFFKGAPIRNWLLYYPVERFLAKFTDILITINHEDYQIAQSLGAKRVEYVPGIGIDLKQFPQGDKADIKANRKKKLGIADETIMILSVGELNKNKNHEVVIKALNRLRERNFCYVICGQGKLEKRLRKSIANLDLENNVKLLGYRNDISEIFLMADIFVFPSLREGLSVSLMEAMASVLPVVCTNIRGNTDLVINKKGGYLIEHPKDINLFSLRLKMLINDEKLRRTMGAYNHEQIQKFEIGKVNKTMKNIYKGIN